MTIYEFKCGDMPEHEGCHFMARSDSKEEVKKMIMMHGKEAHNQMVSDEEAEDMIEEVEE